MSESQILQIHRVNNYDRDGNLESFRGIRLGIYGQGIGTPPQVTGIGQRAADLAELEGWLTRVNPTVLTAPGGPVERPLAKVHTFVPADEIVFHTLDGDVRYRVTRQPGKYDGDGSPSQAAGDPSTVVHYDYRLELVED